MQDSFDRIDDGQALRYNLETQDEAYRTGAYDYILDIAMMARMAVIAAYLKHYGAGRVLDIGCGPGPLLTQLPDGIGYVGVDVAESAIAQARARFAGRPDTVFHIGNFRDIAPPAQAADAVVWAGIGRTWTRQGKGGDRRDWLEILDIAERWLTPDGLVVLELVTAHRPALDAMLGERYTRLVGCDIDHLDFDARGRRAIRVYRRGGAK